MRIRRCSGERLPLGEREDPERFERERELPSLRLQLFALQICDGWISCDDTTCSDDAAANVARLATSDPLAGVDDCSAPTLTACYGSVDCSSMRSGESGMAGARSGSRCSRVLTAS